VPFTAVEKNAERVVGLSAEEIRKYSPDELRRFLERRNKKKLFLQQSFLLSVVEMFFGTVLLHQRKLIRR